MAPTLPRSTLEEMWESIKKTDDKQRDMPPALPQRPTSRARLPSSIRGRKSASSSSDKSRQSVDNHSKNSRPSKPGSNSESPGTSVGGSPPKSERSVDSGRIGNGNKPASPKSRAASSSNSPSGSVNVGRPSKDKDEAEVNSNGHKINNDHTVRNSTSGGRLSENGGSTPPTASSSNAAAASSRKWKDESLAGLKKNSRVWCLTPEKIWTLGLIHSTKDTESVVRTLDGQLLKAATPTILPANPDILEGVDDLVQLSYLNEPAVLHNLEFRYAQDKIYTKAGPVLIAINPFKKVPIYTPDLVYAYRQPKAESSLGPHVYVTADCAYGAMVKDGVNQAIIISGESGAGKTETAKIAMQYLAALGGGGGVENEILQTNPILEAFGNAKTLRNDNSSRFGKLIDIHFDRAGKICGAKIQTYLLEKSRVVQQSNGERSYHIFYQLCAGADSKLRERLKLLAAEEYNYLNQSNCMTIDNVDDVEQFRLMKNAMKVVQISQTDQESAFAMLAAVLWIGNINFSVVDTENHVTIVDKEAVKQAAGLLNCKVDKLVAALSTRRIRAGNEDIVQTLTHAQALDSRDALAKAIYANLFDWLVDRINKSLEVGKRRTGRSISILDIYGFESFQKNSFEQLCINYANERLQQHFNRHLFKLEQEEYTQEHIDWTRVDFEDNQECLDLIEKKPLGLISLLDEECTFPRASSVTFANKLKEHLKGNACFKGERTKAFRICHYAGEVTYDTSGFLEKNRDLLHGDLVQLLGSCNNSLPQLFAANIGENVQRLLSPTRKANGTESQNQSQKQSVATKFKGQLFKLMQRLESTEPHFIRCIKPNSLQLPNIYEQELVLQQLRCCGVLEVVRISRSGYPTRHSFQQFADRYSFLLPKPMSPKENPLSVCVAILKQFGIPQEMYQVGITKLFFRAGQIGQLEDTRLHTLQGVIGVQSLFRGYKVRCWYRLLRHTAIFCQTLVRGAKARREFKILKERHYAAIIIQKHFRRKLATWKYHTTLQMIVVVQSAVRSWLAMKELEKLRLQKAETDRAAKLLAEQKAAAEAAELAAARERESRDFREAQEAKEAQEAAAAAASATAAAKSVAVTTSLVKDKEHVKETSVPAPSDSKVKDVEVDTSIKVQPSVLLELQKRALAAEKSLREKEEDNALLKHRLQQFEARWLEHQAKMESMEEMWQKQMTSLQLSLAAAKKSLANDEPTTVVQREEERLNLRISVSRHRASRHILPQDDDDFDWDDSTTLGTKSPDMSVTPRKYPPHPPLEYPLSRGELDAGRSLVGHLVKEFDQRTQVFNDDADFLVEVKSGQTEANLNPDEELRKLKHRFDVWKKDFKVRLRETKTVLHKLGSMDAVEKTKKKWWGKRGNV
uniref:Myosin VIII n=1 Tax=Marchantia polymorpha TaxID=3197 RepID=H3JRT8_MARPO|nr:myosin VIII [Marchantia polymorpha]